LQLGDYKTLLADNLFAFSRTHENQTVIVIINNFAQTRSIKLDFFGAGKFVDRLEDNRIFVANDGRLNLELQAQSGRILVRIAAG